MSADQVEDIYELAPMQQGILFHIGYAPNSGQYHNYLACRFSGRLDEAAFQAAWREVIRRHPALRTSFHFEGLEQPVQVVHRQVEPRIEHHDWRECNGDGCQQRLEELLEQDRARGFDVSAPPVMRLMLARLADDAYEFVWTHNHLILDGWSTSLVIKEVFALYEGLRRGQPLRLPAALPYGEFIGWLQQQDLAVAEKFWKRYLAGFDTATPLPYLGAAQRRHREPQIERCEVRLAGEQMARLQAFARTQQVTVNTVLVGAWALLLSHYSGERDVVFGTTLSGRPPALRGVDTTVGLFINTLPFRVAIRDDAELPAWLKQIQDDAATLRQHEVTPLANVQKWAGLAPGNSLFDSILVFENYPIDESVRHQQGDMTFGDVQFGTSSHYPITVVITTVPETLLRVSYDRNLLRPEVVERLTSHFATLVENLIARADQRLGEIQLLPPTDRAELLSRWNQNPPVPGGVECLHDAFARQARLTPERTAIVCEQQRLSYRELDERSNQLAHELVARGVGAETLVGIALKRCPEMIVGLVAVLKAGGGYVPMDPDQPAERLHGILADAGIRIVLTLDRYAEKLAADGTALVRLDADWPRIAERPLAGMTAKAQPENVAYVLYTSGTTGRPKGVVVEHRQIANYVRGVVAELGIAPDAAYAMLQPLTVDSSQTSIFSPLVGGGCLHLIREERGLSPSGVAEYFDEHAIDVLKIAPSHLAALRDVAEPNRVMPRRWLIVGGEASRQEWVQEMRSGNPPCRIFNHYGPTEATVGTTTYPISGPPQFPTPNVPIGYPLPGTTAYLLDRRLNPAPIGAPGELYLGGEAVARGYLGRPELTAAAFVPDPFCARPGGRLYRTGDVCRRLPDGSIDFIGRNDDQIKIRGFRVEPGEIEAALRQSPQVRQTVVVVRKDDRGVDRLVAYVVWADPAKAPGDVNAESLRAEVKRRVPEHMVPSVFVPLAELPRSAHGKLDRNALPAPEWSAAGSRQEYAAPRNRLETRLAELWQAVLKVERAGIHDDFFALGGDSIQGAMFVNRVQEQLGVRLMPTLLFETPTIAALADHLAAIHPQLLADGATGQPARRPIERLPRVPAASGAVELPLSFAQERLWLVDQMTSGDTAYNMTAAVRVSGPLDLGVVERSFTEIVARHETLRTTFHSVGSQPVQRVLPTRPFTVEVTDLQALHVDEREAAIQREVHAELGRPFDLSRGPLLRVRAFRLDTSEHVLVVAMHHIVSDGWSMGVFLGEFAAFYDALSQERQPVLPPIEIQYADYAAWQRRVLDKTALDERLDWWRERLAGLPALELPTDRPRPAEQTSRGANHRFHVAPAILTQLQDLSRAENASLFMSLIAGFSVVMHAASGQDDIALGTDVANRDREAVERLIGFFVNQLVLRVDVAGDPTFRQIVGRVREMTLGAYAHQDLPFDKLVAALRPRRDPGRSPLFDVKLALQNTPVPRVRPGGLDFRLFDLQLTATKFDLLVNLAPGEAGITGEAIYRTDLFDRPRIERWMGQFVATLELAAANPETTLSTLRERLQEQEQQERADAQQRKKQANLQRLRRGGGRAAAASQEAPMTNREANP